MSRTVYVTVGIEASFPLPEAPTEDEALDRLHDTITSALGKTFVDDETKVSEVKIDSFSDGSAQGTVDVMITMWFEFDITASNYEIAVEKAIESIGGKLTYGKAEVA